MPSNLLRSLSAVATPPAASSITANPTGVVSGKMVGVANVVQQLESGLPGGSIVGTPMVQLASVLSTFPPKFGMFQPKPPVIKSLSSIGLPVPLGAFNGLQARLVPPGRTGLGGVGSGGGPRLTNYGRAGIG